MNQGALASALFSFYVEPLRLVLTSEQSCRKKPLTRNDGAPPSLDQSGVGGRALAQYGAIHGLREERGASGYGAASSLPLAITSVRPTSKFPNLCLIFVAKNITLCYTFVLAGLKPRSRSLRSRMMEVRSIGSVRAM
jgi:hypothetical protein